MSERRKIGDKVMVYGRRGAEGYVCLITNGHENERPDKCINMELGIAFKARDYKIRCDDPECKEWPTLKILKVIKPLSDAYKEEGLLCHVSECQMTGAKGGH